MNGAFRNTRVHTFVSVEGIKHDVNARFLLKQRHRFGINIISPRVDIDFIFVFVILSRTTAAEVQAGKQYRQDGKNFFQSNQLLFLDSREERGEKSYPLPPTLYYNKSSALKLDFLFIAKSITKTAMKTNTNVDSAYISG